MSPVDGTAITLLISNILTLVACVICYWVTERLLSKRLNLI